MSGLSAGRWRGGGESYWWYDGGGHSDLLRLDLRNLFVNRGCND